MPETEHVDTEGRLAFCALLMQIIKSGWLVEVSQDRDGGRFEVDLSDARIGKGRSKHTYATGATLLPALTAAWQKAQELDTPAAPSIG